MLPEYAQGRKAIWAAVNPHTGKRRIDEAFPREIRASTNEQEMFIRFVNGSTWQVVGSDRYDSAVGSPPAGVTFSEWALSNPSAWAYLSPILLENDGWAAFITTPRGKNHAYGMYRMAKDNPDWFAQVLSVKDTGIIRPELIESQRKEYHGIYGIDAGDALIEQEYYCSFEAAILGAIYGREMKLAQDQGRITTVAYDPAYPVHTAWDLGWRDDTGIWFYQSIAGASGKDIPHFAELVKAQPYQYGIHWLPHDARAKTLASGGKSTVEQLGSFLGAKNVRIVPNLSVQDGIQAVRYILPRVYFDEIGCFEGLEALRSYRRVWNDERKMFLDQPYHDWASNGSDAFRMLAIAWREENQPDKVVPRRDPGINMTFRDLERYYDSQRSESWI